MSSTEEEGRGASLFVVVAQKKLLKALLLL
jgi:hypothetical protein